MPFVAAQIEIRALMTIIDLKRQPLSIVVWQWLALTDKGLDFGLAENRWHPTPVPGDVPNIFRKLRACA
jgi:hypothetical protein